MSTDEYNERKMSDDEYIRDWSERLAHIKTAIMCIIGNRKEVALSERESAVCFLCREQYGLESAIRHVKRKAEGHNELDSSK